jgi:hypothetical protein
MSLNTEPTPSTRIYEDSPDASPKARPGVPAERATPEPVANAHWVEPPRQTPRGKELKDVDRPELTATFGTGQPPRGLSGLLRKRAYRIPDYRARRWMLLLLADRIDAIESLILPSRS